MQPFKQPDGNYAVDPSGYADAQQPGEPLPYEDRARVWDGELPAATGWPVAMIVVHPGDHVLVLGSKHWKLADAESLQEQLRARGWPESIKVSLLAEATGAIIARSGEGWTHEAYQRGLEDGGA